ncbi:MAG: ribose-phosphate pyrophosphokinase-like domain-containing protein [Armatimonadetes bacterium]|nr:ribose-phosphate pyrophosphokinase-like domain-containing protein [Armatimonadota bacterium]
MLNHIVLIGDETSLLKNFEKHSKSILKYREHKFSNDNFIYSFDEDTVIEDINIIADLSSNLHKELCGLFFLLDYFKRNKIAIKSLFFPYFPYSRTNHIHKNQTANLFMIVEHLNLYDIKRICCCDSHFQNQDIGLKAELHIIEQEIIFAQEFKKIIHENTIVIGPDRGSKKRVDKICSQFRIQGFCFDKKRINHQEKVVIKSNAELDEIIKKAGEIVLIDDEICSGNTLKKITEYVSATNPGCKINIFATHSFMNNVPDFINNKNIKNVYTTNSIHLASKLKSNKIIIKDISSIIAGELHD